MALKMAMKSNETTNLVLIGKTGNGKSATGNTILGAELFESTGDSTSVTKSLDYNIKKFEGRNIKVLDTPGFADTDNDKEGGLNLVTEAIREVIRVCPSGFHACLLVLKYGNRFTGEEKVCIASMKGIFGQKFVQKYCIILMTGGDDFDHNCGKKGNTFENWCWQQTGDFKYLFQECGGKIVLFNNKLEGESKLNQVRQLLREVDKLGGRCYTDKHFEKAEKDREILMLNAKLPNIRDETMTEVSLILQEMNEILKKKSNYTNDQKIIQLKIRSEALLENLKSQDNKTGVLNGLMDNVKSIISSASEELKVRERVHQEIENLKSQDNKTGLLNGLMDTFKSMLYSASEDLKVRAIVHQEMEKKEHNRNEINQMQFLQLQVQLQSEFNKLKMSQLGNKEGRCILM